MKKVNELKGFPVIARTTGKRVGEFGEIIFDTKSGEVTGITLSRNGKPEKVKVVLYHDIIKFEDQQILIKSQSAVTSAVKVPDLPEMIKMNQQLVNRSVITDEGKEIGSISDMVFDEQDGYILGFELADSLIKDIVDGRRFIAFDDLRIDTHSTVVNQEVAEALEPSIGGLKKILRIEGRR